MTSHMIAVYEKVTIMSGTRIGGREFGGRTGIVERKYVHPGNGERRVVLLLDSRHEGKRPLRVTVPEAALPATQGHVAA